MPEISKFVNKNWEESKLLKVRCKSILKVFQEQTAPGNNFCKVINTSLKPALGYRNNTSYKLVIQKLQKTSIKMRYRLYYKYVQFD